MGNAIQRGQCFFARTGDLWLAAILAVAAIYFFSGRFTTVRFDRERIEIRVERGLLRVTGLYHYTNASQLPAVLTLSVPFPVDREHLAPESYLLSEASQEGHPLAEVPFVFGGGEVRFRLVFGPGEAKWIRLDYAQPTEVSNGRYLLTTTRAWRRPIGRADYVLRLPRDFRLVASNYSINPAPAVGPWETYTFSKSNFYPAQDWDFAWDEPCPRAAIREAGHP